MFSKLLGKIIQNKRTLFIVIIGAFLYFIMSDSVFAATEVATFEQTRAKIAQVVQFISTIIAVFLALLTYLITMFLSPEWINGSLFGLNSVFKSIWILVSNVVYLVFAFILIWIAFMNIVGKGGDKYQLKQALPKFIVGILIVPFSWFLVNFILSLSSVLTISALNLPFDTFPAYSNKMEKVNMYKKCTFNPDNLGTSTGSTDLNKILNCDKENSGNIIKFTDLINSDKAGDSIFGVIGIYTFGVVNLENFDHLNAENINKVKNMVELIIKIAFDFIFIVIYSILMIALGLVLMTRGIYIWIYMMMSPVFGLMYFFDKTEGGSGFFEKFNLKQFISLAFVPVFAMLALSFGLLFLYVVGNGMTTQPGADAPKSNITITENSFKVNDVELKIEGSLSGQQSITNFMKEVGNGGLGVIGSLILKIFGIVVLWGAVMAALRTNEITKAVVEPLYQFGTKVGEMAKASPQYLPVFGGQSMSSLSTAAGTVSSGIQSAQQKKGSELGQRFLPLDDNAKALRAIADRTYSTNKDALDGFKRANSLAGAEKIVADKHARDAYERTLKEFSRLNGFGNNKTQADELIGKFHNAKTAAEIREILAQLHNLSQDGQLKLFGSSTTANVGNIDSLISQNGSGVQQQQTPGTPAAGTQTVNLNITGVNNIDLQNKLTMDGSKVTGLSSGTVDQIAGSIGTTSQIKKDDFISKFKAELIRIYGTNIDDATAKKIAEEVADKIGDGKFKP